MDRSRIAPQLILQPLADGRDDAALVPYATGIRTFATLVAPRTRNPFMKSIFWGAVIIAIGLVRGDSVFRGDFGAISIFFDALGVFFIIRGLVSIYRAKQQDAAVPPAAPPPPAARR